MIITKPKEADTRRPELVRLARLDHSKVVDIDGGVVTVPARKQCTSLARDAVTLI